LKIGTLILLLASIPICAQQRSVSPEIVGRDIISTPHDEFGGAWDVAGRVIYFNLSIPKGYLYAICSSHQATSGQWGSPQVMPFSGRYRDSDPVLSPDGEHLYFVSDRPVAAEQHRDFDIYVAGRKGKTWGEPRRLSETINSDQAEYFASEAKSGNLYFTSSRKGSLGSIDVYRAVWRDGEFERVENLGPNINAPGVANIEAFIAPDESYLLLGTFGRSDSFGSADLYISFNRGGQFSTPVHLPAGINTPSRDYSPRISSDGKWFLFASEANPAMSPPAQPWTTQQIGMIRTSIRNGLGNIYRLPIEALNLDQMRREITAQPQN